jgi:hypothetical protein
VFSRHSESVCDYIIARRDFVGVSSPKMDADSFEFETISEYITDKAECRLSEVSPTFSMVSSSFFLALYLIYTNLG